MLFQLGAYSLVRRLYKIQVLLNSNRPNLPTLAKAFDLQALMQSGAQTHAVPKAKGKAKAAPKAAAAAVVPQAQGLDTSFKFLVFLLIFFWQAFQKDSMVPPQRLKLRQKIPKLQKRRKRVKVIRKKDLLQDQKSLPRSHAAKMMMMILKKMEAIKKLTQQWKSQQKKEEEATPYVFVALWSLLCICAYSVFASGNSLKKPAAAETKKEESQKKDSEGSEAIGSAFFGWDLRQEYLEDCKADNGTAKNERKDKMDNNQKNGAEEIETDTVLDESQDGNKSNEENAAMEKDTIKKDGANTQLETPDISKELKSVPVDEKKNGEMSGDPPKKKYRADKQKLNAASKAKMTAAKSKATRKGTKEDVAESKAKKRQIAQKPRGKNGKGNNAKKKKDDTTSGKDMTMEQVKKSLHAARNLVTKPSSNVCYKYSLCFGHCERNIFLLRCVTTWRA